MKNKLSTYCIGANRTIKEAVAVISNNFSRCVVVVRDNRKVVGVFCEGDILRAIMGDIDLYVPLGKIVKPSFKYLHSLDYEKAFKMMHEFGITLIPIVNDDFELTDVITLSDLLKYLNDNRRK